MSDLHFGVIGEDGIYVRPMPIDCEEIRVEASGNEPYWGGSMSSTLTVDLVSVDHDAIRDLLGDARRSTYDIAFEHSVTKWLYRHDRVWRYRMERKGDKSNRRRRRRHKNLVSTKTKAVLRNATIHVDDMLSEHVLPRCDVTFDVNVRQS